jgi:predicted Zn finger-like uncharacterized protein
MLLVCPHCSTSYEIDPNTLGATGRSVRCTSCRSVWFAESQQDAFEAIGAGDPEPVEEPTADAMETPAPAPDRPREMYRPRVQAVGNDTDPDAADWIAEADMTAIPLVPEGEGLLGAPVEMPPFDEIDHADGSFADPAADRDPASNYPPSRSRYRGGHAFHRTPGAKASRRPWRVAPLPVAIAVLAGLIAIVLGWRQSIVQFAPQTASFFATIGLPVNLRGTVFQDIRTTQEMHEGIPVLVVEGNIVSVSKKPTEVRRLRFSLRDAAGHEVYSWTALPTRSVVEPGDSVQFRSRVASPPAEGRDVIVRFFNRHDVASATR